MAAFFVLFKFVECTWNPCPLIYSPVCGSDGKTYGNICEFENHACNKPSLTLKHEGECKGDKYIYNGLNIRCIYKVVLSIITSLNMKSIGVFSCEGKECGVMCDEEYMVCDGHGSCVFAESNPCLKHGCDGLNCGDVCLMGDIIGLCDVRLKCMLEGENLGCGKIL